MDSPDPSASRHQGAVLAIILASYLMIILDVSIVITGLPRIMESLSFSTAQLSWVQSIYTLTFGGLLLLGARAGDILGRQRMFQMGLVIFTLASLAIAAAQTAGWLIAARAVQGLGAAILAPSTLALLSSNFREGPARQRATAWYGSIAGIGASVGLVLGGILADWLSWRIGFLINLPVGIALWVAGGRYLQETERNPGRLDVPGAIASTLGFGALIWGVVRTAETGWGEPLTLAAILGGLAKIALFVWHEARTPQPIMPLRLFTDQERLGAYLTRFLFLGAMVTFFFFSTQYMQQVLGFSALEAGLGFLPMTLVNFAVALAGPRLSGRIHAGRQLVLGVVLTFIGMAWLSRAGLDSFYVSGVALPMVLIGAGQGFCFGPMTASGIARTDRRDAGAAAGVLNVSHQLGSSFGLGLMAAIAASAEAGLSGAQAIAHGTQAALTGGSVLLLLAIASASLLILRAELTPANRVSPSDA
jgi:EmrB/QacA subfamily drug resistance transporter